MAAVKRDIYADFTNGALVASLYNAALASFAPPYHEDNLRLVVHPLEINPAGLPGRPYTEIDPTGMSLTASVFDSSGTLLATNSTWTVDGNTLVGNLNLHTSETDTALGSDTEISNAIIEFEFSDADGKVTIQKTGISIKREYITSGSPTVTPPDEYYTKAQIDALFVRFSGNPAGSGIELTSPDGNSTQTLKALDNGTFDAEPA